MAVSLPRLGSDTLYSGLLGLLLAWAAIRANGGLRIEDVTPVQIAVDLIAGAVGALAILVVPALRGRAPGMVAAALFAVLVVVSLVSTIWSVDPAQSWIEANRLVTYLATFGIGMALVRLAPHRWVALLGGVTSAAVIVSAYALMHKTFPDALAEHEVYARLREPFGYWNAVGLMAALGVPGCLWLGARRAGHGALNAFAYPALGLLVTVILLSYSRGALLAAAVGCAFWLAVTPLRLRGFAVLATACTGALLVIAWAFSQDALTEDRVSLPLRSGAGHQLAVAVVVMLAGLLAAGLAINFAAANRAPGHRFRRRAGLAIVAFLALVPAGLTAALSTSDRGLGGSVSQGWESLTDPNARTPSNAPGRLTAVGSVRARYWNEALKIFKDHPVAGVGAGGYALARLRYRNDDLEVKHAHGYVVQVLADRGAIGMAASLAALIAVLVAVLHATGLGGAARRQSTTPERVGLLTLAAVVLIFGIHSFVDWTWFIPGVSIPVLLAAGWLAGRGPLELPPRGPERMIARIRSGLGRQPRLVGAVAVLVLAGAAAWASWQPLRSANAGHDALAAVAEGDHERATELAFKARNLDPLSVEPQYVLATVYSQRRMNNEALAALQEAVRLQPANPGTWIKLAEWQLNGFAQAYAAKKSLAAALYLDPRSRAAIRLLIDANGRIAAGTAS